MKTVLLTGATGFIGRRLQKALVRQGLTVTAMVRPGSANASRLEPGVHAVTTSLEANEVLAAAVSECDALVYCAGSVRGRCLEDFSAANVDGVATMVRAINRSGRNVPMLLVSSLAASRPEVSHYAMSKHLGERQVVEHAECPWCILRPPAVYGPGDREMLPILKMARAGLVTATGPRDQKLSLIHADDVATAVMAWLEKTAECSAQTFCIDDGRPGGYDWRAMANIARDGRSLTLRVPRWLLYGIASANMTVSRLLGYAPMLTPGKVEELTQPDWLCNNGRFSEVTGWQPEIDLEKGLSMLFDEQI